MLRKVKEQFLFHVETHDYNYAAERVTGLKLFCVKTKPVSVVKENMSENFNNLLALRFLPSETTNSVKQKNILNNVVPS